MCGGGGGGEGEAQETQRRGSNATPPNHPAIASSVKIFVVLFCFVCLFVVLFFSNASFQ